VDRTIADLIASMARLPPRRGSLGSDPGAGPGLEAVGGVAYGVVGLTIVVGVALAVLLAGTIVAVAEPARGLQDRLAGTWIVPRSGVFTGPVVPDRSPPPAGPTAVM
jgi:hypothetical protein